MGQMGSSLETDVESQVFLLTWQLLDLLRPFGGKELTVLVLLQT